MLRNVKVLVGLGVLALISIVTALIKPTSTYVDVVLFVAAVCVLAFSTLTLFLSSASNDNSNEGWLLDPDGLPDAIVVTDLNGNIKSSNHAAREILPNCVSVASIKELFDEWHSELPDRQQADQVLDAVLSAPDFQYSETLQLASGKSIERQTRPLPGQASRLWIMRDLTHLQTANIDSAMHNTMVEADAARTAELAEQLFHAKAELEEKQAELRRLAHTDSLTGLLNRRRFTSLGEDAIANAEPSNLWVIMMDIDHFKRINDTYGHAAGDIAIKDFATISQNEVGENGFVGRMGGEEFAAILEASDMNKAIRLAEAIRKKTANHQTIADTEKFRFTASIGVAPWLEGEVSIEAALDRADQALYSAKSYGRNRVVGYEFAQV
ncbi:MAG: diguanylate cyclase [Kordiimonas sp.]